MKITAIRSDRIYRDMMTALPDKKENIYRNQLMKPFEFKWACVGIPLTAAQEGGYDVVSAATMSGFYAPVQITEERQAEIEKISSDTFWASCEASIRNTLAYAEYEKKSASYNTVQQKMLDGEGAAILNEFGKNRSLPPDSVEVQELVKKWQAYITDNYYNCTKEILSCLGQMYVGDERFTQHIDQYGVGTAAFMAAAIEVYTS